jgi:transposase
MTSTKYMGMDVHKESISIAVMNSGGKLGMECVIETKASTIVQFIDGLRGDLRVTFEEGTCAAWLHDLLKPRVTEVVVCNPRKIALRKDGRKSDRIDARKLAEQLYMNKIKPVYHGEHGLRTLKELARSYLTISKELTRVMNRLQALYRRWGIPCRQRSVCTTSPFRMAQQDRRNRRPATCRTLLPTTGCLALLAPGGAAGSVVGKQEAQGLEAASPDSRNWTDPRGAHHGDSADTSSVPHQATAMDL